MYQPIVFTAIDDDMVGESCSGFDGYSGSPYGYYASPALYLMNGRTNISINNAQFRFAAEAVHLDTSSCVGNGQSLTCTDCQFINCFSGCGASGYSATPLLNLGNCLLSGLSSALALDNSYCGAFQCADCTFDTVATLVAAASASVLSNRFDNCILANVQDLGVTNPLSGGVNGFYQTTPFGNSQLLTDENPFFNVGGGAHYLNPTTSTGPEWLVAANTNVVPQDLVLQLRQRSTYAPVDLDETSGFSQDSQGQFHLDPVIPCDTEALALGYHYDKLDYFMRYEPICPGPLTVGPGTVLSCGGTGMWVCETTLTFQGTCTSNCWIVESSVSQEQPLGIYRTFGLASWSNPLTLKASFTKFSLLSSSGYALCFDECNAAGSISLIHSEIHGGTIEGGSETGTFSLTNCLLDHVSMNLWLVSSFLRNCTFLGGSLSLTQCDPSSCNIEDTAFEDTALNLSSGFYEDPSYALFDYNAYLSGSSTLPGGTNNCFVSDFNWQSGPLGNNYLPSDSVLTNAGSTTADQVGLYHFTTQTNQVKEGNSVVDIGYHYVALDANGNPIDSDADGTPDYLADANGNGQVDPGETPWQEIPPAIISQPASQTVNAGTNVTFAVAASGTLPLNYQWQLNGTNLAGATASSVTRTNVQGPESGQYRVIISNPWGSVTSSNAVLLVLPTITTQPIGRAVIVGSNVTFSVAATGSPLAYQWLFNGAAISMATNTTLTLTNVQLADAGSYSVLVSIFTAGIVSSNAALSVFPPGPAPVPAGLISWWRAETNALDAIGGNDGTLTNGGYATGEVGQAFNLNGTNQYVSIPDSSSLRQTNLTVEGWFNFAERSTRTRTLFGKANGGTTDSFTVWCSSAYVYACANASGNSGLYLSYPWIPPTNTWHHIALTFDGTTLTGALYVNGTNVANNTASGWPAFDTHALLLGADIKNGSVTNFFKGRIDEVSLYSRALSLTEIQSIYLAGTSGKSPPGSPQPGGGAETNYTGAVTFTNGTSLFIFEPKPTSHIP